jgi:hypothetical protein
MTQSEFKLSNASPGPRLASLTLPAAESVAANEGSFHLPIPELVVDIAKSIEAREQSFLQFGQSTMADVTDAECRRLGFEIDWLRAKRKLTKK